MTYLSFLGVFVLPPLLIAIYFARKRLSPAFVRALLVTQAIVYAATIPWDSLAIKWGIWSFPTDRLVGVRLGPYLPIEEASFFGLQTLLVALIWRALSRAPAEAPT